MPYERLSLFSAHAAHEFLRVGDPTIREDGWLLMESALRAPAVREVAVQALAELSGLSGLLGHATVAFGNHGPGASPDPFDISTRTMKGLLIRTSLDLAAMAALSSQPDFRP